MDFTRRSWIGSVIGGVVAGFVAKTPKELPVINETTKPGVPTPYLMSGQMLTGSDLYCDVDLIETTARGDEYQSFAPGPRNYYIRGQSVSRDEFLKAIAEVEGA